MFLASDITLQSGDSGDNVYALQERLAQRDLLGAANMSSVFDGPTEQAVREFQGANGLITDGIAGPKTLRLLINIGTQSESGGGESSEEQEEEKDLNKERHDDLALEEQQEQEKLANEAVWGYEAETNLGSGTAQEQLSDLERYNQQHELEQQEQLMESQHEQELGAAQERLDQQRSSEHELEQLQIDQQGMKAVTPMEELEQKQIGEANEDKQMLAEGAETAQEPPEQQPTQEQQAPKPEQAPEAPSAAEQQISAHTFHFEREPGAPVPEQRDPQLMMTESQLDQGSQVSSRQEGQHLDSQGVANEGTVPNSELGELSPDRTPGKQREREVGIA